MGGFEEESEFSVGDPEGPRGDPSRSEIPNVREEAVERALATLAAERERTGGDITLASLERVCDRLKLTPAEMVSVQRNLDSSRDGGSPADELEELADDSDSSHDEESERTLTLVDRMMNHGLLTADQERELGRAVRLAATFRADLADGSVEPSAEVEKAIARGRQAQQGLVLGNVRLAMDIAKRYEGRGLDRDDLLQEGLIGLMRAVESFDSALGFRFSTYATWWIRQSVTRAVFNSGREVRIPVHVAEKLSKLRKAEKKLRARIGTAFLKPKAIADELGWTVEEVGKLLVLEAQRPLSADHEEDDRGSILERLHSPLPDPEHCAIEIDLRKYIDQCLDGLDPRAAEIMRLRFGFGNDSAKTLEEVGGRYGLTRERIRQIEAKTLTKMGLRHGKALAIFIQEGK